jgi:hypothetical protein
MFTSLLRMETLTSQPTNIKDAQLYLLSRVIQMRFPFCAGGLIWNRPVAVRVHQVDGRDQFLPIRDLTRAVILTLFVSSLTGTFLFMLFWRKIA